MIIVILVIPVIVLVVVIIVTKCGSYYYCYSPNQLLQHRGSNLTGPVAGGSPVQSHVAVGSWARRWARGLAGVPV